MFRMFSFLPPIGSYVLALGVLGGTYYLQASMLAANPDTDVNKIWLVGGILAFLLAFGGFQRGLEQKGEAMKPRVSSSDVLEKLTHPETGMANPDLDVPSHAYHEPDANSPLGRLRARSNPGQHEPDFDSRSQVWDEPEMETSRPRLRTRSRPIEQP
ncbi:MAG: hypothetical protein LJE62_06835 [Silicimonas sp.]|jgi:hypothetical protein|nr:hypothetical protein [Silicimonas sp.]